ncbi:uncharacterized protein LOC106094858 [Stomoxys calcitrans]|uniref:uncharacterized protein LOC106094858 n=1 Tax=Stomoxys calcitrans TaxID=35570 RepID=UPI0027E256D4|nr:uncharacterized protein LOC106094858 [Stomoxys calcitrans]
MIIKNDKNIVVPDYLNEAFFVCALEEGLRDIKIVIREVEFAWGSKPGENYCSSIYRCTVTYDCCGEYPVQGQKLHLIVKAIPVISETVFLEDVGVFIKEKLVYSDVLPRLEVLSKNDKFGAKFFYTTKSPLPIIVFNDLKTEGYQLASRQKGLDWHHSSLVLKQLAKFHATSMVLLKKDPCIAKRFTKGMLCEETILKSDTFFHMFGGYLNQLIKTSATWPGYENINTKLQKYYNNFKEITYKLAKPKEGDRFSVINHGDLWSTNFMFGYDDELEPTRPTRLIFVDFQLTIHGSPAIDINFFLNTSVQLDVLKTRRQELIEVYYKVLVENLEYLRYEPIPSFEDLQYELRSRELYGFFGLFGFLPMVTMPEDLSNDASIEAFTNEEYKARKLADAFSREQLQNYMKFGLKRYADLGVLDEF